MAASKSGISIIMDTRALSRLSRDLRRAVPEAHAAAQARIRAAAQVVADEAKGRASYSKRIPGSIRVRGSGLRLKIVAGGAAAADAAPLENQGRQGTFRHPLWGNWDPPKGGYKNHGKQWIDGDPRNQQARPFLAPAMDAHREMVAEELEAAVREAVIRALS